MNPFTAHMPAATTLFSIYASFSAILMLLRSVFNELIPKPLRDYIISVLPTLFKPRSKHLTLVIEENPPSCYPRNHVFEAAEAYLSTKLTTPSTDRLKIVKAPKDKTLSIRFEKGEEIPDSYEGISLCWRFCSQEKASSDHYPTMRTEARYFELTLEKRYKDKVVNSYLPYVLGAAQTLKEEAKVLKLYTLQGDGIGRGEIHWDKVNLEHPSTFQTMAMDPNVKTVIMDDLDRFTKRKDYYKRAGRAWKRGYLLYGPPGTGKSSLIAAMANYLRFDVYDLQLGSFLRDSDLRRLLLATSNRSILVIEDIDCSVELKNRDQNKDKSDLSNSENDQSRPYSSGVQLTLSGLLNFIDGLWSSCGDQRIIIFTTNHKEKLDPALLRPGRMDMHIHMSHLTFPAFRILASNYLQIEDQHMLFEEIERLLETVHVTPAQVAEELMRSDDTDEALQEVIKLLKSTRQKMADKDGEPKDRIEENNA